jgi:glycerophosphoryl diester phosphodiesterase
MVCAAALSPAAMAAGAYEDVVNHDKPVVVEHFDKGAITSAAPALGQAASITEPASIDLPKPISAGDITVEWWQWWDTNDEKTLMSGVGDDGARLFAVRIRTPEAEKKKKKPLPLFAFGDDAAAMVAASPYPARWTYLAAVFKSTGEAQLFVNGYPIKLVQLKSPAKSHPLTQISIAPDHATGKVDEVAVYDRALKPEQIKSHFLAAVHSLPTHQIIVIGHRGDNKSSPENTRISYENAIKNGAKFVEMDLHLTKDKKIVLMHDDTVKRTTGKTGKVSDYLRDDIIKLDAGSWKDPKYKGEPVPKIEDVGETCRGKAVMMLDLKSTGQAQQIADWLKSTNFPMDGILLAPWTEEEGIALRKLLPQPLMTELHSTVPENFDDAYFEKMKGIGFNLLSINWQNLPQDFIDAAHKNGLKIHSWTFNRHGASGTTDITGGYEVAGAVLAGVDGIITDDTVTTQKQIDELTSR